MTRVVNEAALSLIKQFESCRLHAYPDPATGAEPWTCGWGAIGPDIHPGTVWTQAQADAHLQQDVASHAEQVALAIGTVPTTDNQFGAMTSLAYNIGIGNFRSSSVLRHHIEGNPHSAQLAFSMWVKGDGHVLGGLVQRRKAEAELYGSASA